MTETRPKRRYLTSGERHALAADLKTRYEAGASVRQLAEETGRSYGSVSGLLHLADTQMRPAVWPADRLTGDARATAKQAAADVYEAGHAIRCAADAIGRSWTYTRNLLVEADIKFRPRNSRCTASH
ncbi:helix-turn-helix domain-containing protein [Streptomyces sp. NPDC051133]|uniref:helix-turn-helix domain-containing protein n=1 Tax=Streptomyces sp. NPDC051133 TaxID=3155521 RepID=UPI003431089C